MRRLALWIAVVAAMAMALPAAGQEELPPGGSFYDDQGSVHESSIEGLAASGITRGCRGEVPVFCPERPVTRGEMAAFLDRALDLGESASERYFTDIDDSIFADSIDRLAAAGITYGCNPPANSRFCPDQAVSRGEMATFLDRALQLEPASEPAGFTDISDSVHQVGIANIAAVGITKGCNPPDNTRFCPRDPVIRAQMASFLVRALDLPTFTPPPLPEIERVSRFTTYHDCCEPRVHNIQLLADTLDGHVVYPGGSFSINDVIGPRTTAKGYVPAPVLCSSGLCEGVGGGISQFATTMFNAIFWGGYEELEHRPHSIWLDRYPVGIEATLGYPSLDVAFRNDTVTPVTIRTRHTGTSITVELWGNAGGWEMSGYHPMGSRSSVIDVIDDTGRKVSGRVFGTVGSNGGSVRIERTLTEDGESRTDTWYWTYQPG